MFLGEWYCKYLSVVYHNLFAALSLSRRSCPLGWYGRVVAGFQLKR